MSESSGYVYRDESDGKWVVRITWTEDGKRRQFRRKRREDTGAEFRSKNEATDELNRLRALVTRGDPKRARSVTTFAALADHYREHYLIPPQYVDGRKVAGLRSYDTPRRQLKMLRVRFGEKKLRTFTFGDVKMMPSDFRRSGRR